MKEMGSWIDYWESSFPILHWSSGTWLRTTGRAGILGGGDWIILQSSSSVNYHSFFLRSGRRGEREGGVVKESQSPPRLSCGSLIDCIGALYDKASSLKEAGFSPNTCVYSKSLSGFKNGVNLSTPYATMLEWGLGSTTTFHPIALECVFYCDKIPNLSHSPQISSKANKIWTFWPVSWESRYSCKNWFEAIEK